VDVFFSLAAGLYQDKAMHHASESAAGFMFIYGCCLWIWDLLQTEESA